MRSRGLILAVVLLVGGLLVSCSGTAEPFDFDSDDLCERVSAEEVAGFVEEAFGWEATAVAVEPVGEDYWECIWEVTSNDGEDRMVYAREAEWFNFDGGPIYLTEEEVVDFADLEEPFVPIMGAVSGHPSLDEGVVVVNGGFGAFAFGVPPSDQYLQVSVGADEDWESFELKFFAFANSFIEELGWLPTTGT